jgi:hypothetical protein
MPAAPTGWFFTNQRVMAGLGRQCPRGRAGRPHGGSETSERLTELDPRQSVATEQRLPTLLDLTRRPFDVWRTAPGKRERHVEDADSGETLRVKRSDCS